MKEDRRAGLSCWSDWIERMHEPLKKAIPKTPKGEHVAWAVFLGLSVIFLWSAFSGPQGVIQFLKLRSGLEDLEKENEVLLIENQLLEKQVYWLRNSPAYLEKIAREEYGYIYAGEKVYRFPESDPTAGGETGEEKSSRKGRAGP